MSTLVRHIFSAVDEREWKEIKEKILMIFRQFGFEKVIEYKTFEDAGDTGDVEDRGDSLHLLWVLRKGDMDPLMNEIGKVEGIAIVSDYSSDLVTVHVTQNGEFFKIYEGISNWYTPQFSSGTPEEQPSDLAEAKATLGTEDNPEKKIRDMLSKIRQEKLRQAGMQEFPNGYPGDVPRR